MVCLSEDEGTIPYFYCWEKLFQFEATLPSKLCSYGRILEKGLEDVVPTLVCRGMDR